MTTRAARLIATGVEKAEKLLTVTFTRKAAEEVKERLRTLLGPRIASRTQVKTFNAIGLAQVRDKPSILGLSRDFDIAEEGQTNRIIADLLAARIDLIIRLKLDEKFLERRKVKGVLPDEGEQPDPAAAGEGPAPVGLPGGLPGDLPGERYEWRPTRMAIRAVAMALAHFKANLILAGEAEAAVRSLYPEPEDQAIPALAASLYGEYQAELRRQDLADFGDMILAPVREMQRSETQRRAWATKFGYIQIDEFQDTNPAQFRWVSLMVRGHGNICCVGDDDQTIFRFNSADPQFVIGFETYFPGARRVVMVDNFRNGGNILATANMLIGRNNTRVDKRLLANRAIGEKVRIGGFGDVHQEAAFVAGQIADFLKQRPEASCFILYRSNFESRRFEEALITARLRYRIVGDLGFYARLEIQDALSWFELAENWERPAGECYPLLDRLIHRPARGIGEKSLELMRENAGGGSLFSDAALADLREDRRLEMEGLRQALLDYGLSHSLPLADRASRLLGEVGYLGYWEESEDTSAPDRLRNLQELGHALQNSASMPQFLDHARRAAEQSDEKASVQLMTMHRSKGLEAELVLLAGWDDENFPPKPSLEAAQRNHHILEDERRLGYVGLTRGRELVHITYPESRYGAPRIASRFLDELPDAHVERRRWDRDNGVWVEIADEGWK